MDDRNLAAAGLLLAAIPAGFFAAQFRAGRVINDRQRYPRR